MAESPQSWLRAALRFSLSATSHSTVDDAYQNLSANAQVDEDPGRNPRFKKLFDAVLFSRSLILTYNLVLAVILVSVAVVHWGGKAREARRWRIRAIAAGGSHAADVMRSDRDAGAKIQEAERSSSSSSSSTLEGTATPPDFRKDATYEGERQPLLFRQGQKPYHGGYRLVNNARAWLMYQPRAVPFIKKVLPSNGLTLAILLFVGLNVFYTFYNVELSVFMLFVFADRAGLMFVANLPILYLFAAKNQPIKLLTGYSYESLNIFHRRLGEVMCVLALLHSAGMVGVWYTLLRPGGFTFARFIFSKIILLGLGAFFSYELIYFTSLGSFRQRWYELFLVLHVALQAAALVLLWFHHYDARVYVGVALSVFLVDRLVFRLGLKTTSMRASLTIAEDGSTVLLSNNWTVPSTAPWRRLFGQSIKYGWRPTDHVFLTIPSLSHKHIIQAHPFTIASAAPRSSLASSNTSSQPQPHAWLTLLVRAQDGFSRDILNYAKSHTSVVCRLDGPYGSSHALDTLHNSDLSVIVAGGSGIAVAFPIVWELLHPATATEADIEGSSHNDNKRKVCLIWVVHSRSHLSWLPEERYQELADSGADICIPTPTEESGRPDVGALVRQKVEVHSGGHGKLKAGVVVSGPDAMNRDVRNACAQMVADGKDVGVEVEKFGW
ncbi:hypothetical protein W97_07071 [Coniosporium apollinis CBS 100218]|uniref:FAD-binding FR-type domain-containing protein n=1 Tax=Coniosporium apollinis (strain CBS 100218) TaxID=1168221 RepID=R7Z1L9_CONA1|nr:uncharacterized protein W97_07071 [Coniosporium apollinis CBS 100218]EON67816.1 hypothetical protein W97_07071 [Coniosporium apollinis CBS 100218]